MQKEVKNRTPPHSCTHSCAGERDCSRKRFSWTPTHVPVREQASHTARLPGAVGRVHPRRQKSAFVAFTTRLQRRLNDLSTSVNSADSNRMF
jgi:hypothetical protein